MRMTGETRSGALLTLSRKLRRYQSDTEYQHTMNPDPSTTASCKTHCKSATAPYWRNEGLPGLHMAFPDLDAFAVRTDRHGAAHDLGSAARQSNLRKFGAYAGKSDVVQSEMGKKVEVVLFENEWMFSQADRLLRIETHDGEYCSPCGHKFCV